MENLGTILAYKYSTLVVSQNSLTYEFFKNYAKQINIFIILGREDNAPSVSFMKLNVYQMHFYRS